jgi:O-antigen ligase
MQPLPLPVRAEHLARRAAAFLGFSIPISVALDNVLLAVIAVLWLAGGDFRRKLADIAANPVALAALALFGMMAAGLLYGERHPGDGLRYLGKYVDLLFVPVFVTLFHDARTREAGLRWFCVAMILAFVMAELAATGLIADSPVLARNPGHSFKASITHGLLSAFAALVFALLALREPKWPQRLLFAVLALIAVKNVLALGISRTGYLVLALLALHFAFAAYGRRGLAVAGLALALSLSALYGTSETFRERVDTVVVDEGNWRSNRPSRESVTVRLEWYRQSIDVVASHPLLGVGTGAFPKALAENARSASAYPPNPHNEYLAIGMQTGLVGLLLLVHLFWRQWATAPRLATAFETQLARGLVITLAVGCLFNSFLLDHAEGLFFAWFTGLLFGGLGSAPAANRAP